MENRKLQYTKEIESKNNIGRVKELAKNILFAQSFQIENDADSYISFSNKSLMPNSKASPLSKASFIKISFEGDKIVLEAELKGIRMMIIFLISLLGGLGILFLLFFGLFMKGKGSSAAFYSLSPWVVAGPMMVWMFKKQTIGSLDAFVNNIANG